MKISELINELSKFSVEDIQKLSDLVQSHDLTILIGNGGSNSVCSHIAQDYTKMLGKRAIAFSDPSRLTCYINDYGIKRICGCMTENNVMAMQFLDWMFLLLKVLCTDHLLQL